MYRTQKKKHQDLYFTHRELICKHEKLQEDFMNLQNEDYLIYISEVAFSTIHIGVIV